MYQLKLLQLIDIVEYENDSYLHIKFQLDQEAYVYWKLDNETASHIKAITDFSKGYLYRLSLKAESSKSSLTQTYREQSLRLDFSCTENYSQELNQLTKIETVAELDSLPFLYQELGSNDETELEKAAISEVTKPTKRKRSWVFSTVLITAMAILLTYTGHSIIINALAKPAKEAVVHEVVEKAADALKEIEESKPETLLLEENITIEDEPDLPFYVLEEGTSHSVPEGMVALTFDDGPSQFTSKIVDTLANYQVGGTFFLVGANVNKFPGQAEYIDENGYSIGSHSMTHTNFASSAVSTQKHELQQSASIIEATIGDNVTLFRPPFGHFNATTEKLTQQLGQKMVIWNNDPKDWNSKSANQIIHHIKSTKVSGSIILLHEKQATVDALPEIISYLQGLGLKIVSLR
ncbi:polysaccharide deacetylase family protein [Ornithinibacillus scapharcae]|uniref:polysaccharide deacetylase family protein n=1 Tax=Ornithinibacillus scapharcae TaxID=1147159 RepID=UPI000225BA9E|nr:polysaccharide deacetylase family protein [Ornithinibacillus scapharcae]